MATTQTPMLPGLGGGTGGAQLTPGALPSPQMNPQLAMTALNPTPVVTAQPKPTSPQVQGAGQPAAPGLTAPGGAQPGQTLQQPQMQQFVGGSPLVPIPQLLNTAPPPPDLTAFGTQGTGPTDTSGTAEKYNKYFAEKAGTEAPPTNPMRDTATQDALSQHAPDSQEDPTKTFIDAYAGMNPVEKNIYDYFNTMFSTPQTQTSFAEEYAKTFARTDLPTGLPGESIGQEQLALMNLNNIMDGRDETIAEEINKVGGLASETMIQNIASARNKVLLKQAKVLQDSIALKQDYVNQLMTFTQLDRAEVEKQVDRKLGLADKILGMQEKMNNAAASNWEKAMKNFGPQGVFEMLKDNPGARAQAEKAMGLPVGTLANEAVLAIALKEDQELQFISGTENQQAGVFNKTKGTFTPSGGGGGSTGGGGTIGGGMTPALDTAISTILGSGTFSKIQRQDLINGIQSGGDPFTIVKNQAKNIMGQTLATNLSNQEKAYGAMQDLEVDIQRYYDEGGKSNIFAGTFENTLAKVGEVSDPKLRQIATEIEGALQTYRNAVSGTAYSVQEGKAIASIFPGITKTEGLNKAIISGRMKVFESVIDKSYRDVLGEGVYDNLKAVNQPSPTQGFSLGDGTSAAPNLNNTASITTDLFMTLDGKTYMKGADGTYELFK